MIKTTRCSHCGKALPVDAGSFCDSTCAWFANERGTRRMGSLRRDADGDWQEDASHRYEVDRW